MPPSALPGSGPGRCAPERLSALVDGALPDADRERLLAHLTGCPSCRAEAAELRRVRDLLTGASTTAPAPTSADLSRRLVQIAGEESDVPLWTRPFDPARGRATPLPLSHEVLRRRVGSAAALAVVLLIAVTGVGWVAAPPTHAAVAEPGRRAQNAFGAALTQLPLGTEGMAALVLSGTSALGPLHSSAPVTSAADDLDTSRPLNGSESLLVLQNSAVAAALLPRTGVQDVAVRVGDDVVRARVEVAARPGQSTQVTVSSPSGERLGSGSLAPATQPAPVELLQTTHRLTGYLDADTVLGRRAGVVQALDADGRVAARWWIDAETGLLLRTERYDADGRPVAVAGYVSLDVDRDVFQPRLAPRMTAVATSAIELSEAPELSAQGWSCDDELAGLPLVQLRTTADGVLMSSYSDGVQTVVVSQQRGRLDGGPAGFERDERSSAWRRVDSLPAQLVWQSGDRVITVTTDSADGTVWDAVAELPHDEPTSRSAVGRVVEGWQRVTSVVLQR